MQKKERSMKTLATLAGVAALGLIIGSASATTVNFDDPNQGPATINGATFDRCDPQPFGSAHRVFLRYQDVGGDHGQVDDNNINENEEGYNTDHRPISDDPFLTEDLTDLQHTHSVLVSDIDLSTGFAHFTLDTNEPNSAAQLKISLEKLQIFLSDSPTLIGYDGVDFGGHAVLVYDMDLGSDSTILMSDINSGSGVADLCVDIPITPDPLHPYLILYAYQGRVDQETQGGFEEWGFIAGENVIPLPAAAWMGLSLLGGLGAIKKLRSRKA
jgi:hypothetical protein